jgi:hypothetical protein
MIDRPKRSKVGSGRFSGRPGGADFIGIEALESRQLLSAHLPCAHVSASAAVPADPPIQTHIAISEAPLKVQRLNTSNQFTGFDYTNAIAKNPPPAVTTITADMGEFAGMTAPPPNIVIGGSGQIYRGFKTSLEHGGPPPAGPLTPLAQTPAAIVFARAAFLSAGDLAVNVLPTSAPGSDPATAAPSAPAAVLGTAVTVIPQEVASDAGRALAAPVVEGLALASGKASDALAFVASGPDAVGAVAFNFVHFNPAVMVNDAISSFANESIALANDVAAPAVVRAPVSRAWTITAGVIAVDLLLMGYCFQRARRDAAQRRRRMQSWGIEIDPCPERLL